MQRPAKDRTAIAPPDDVTPDTKPTRRRAISAGSSDLGTCVNFDPHKRNTGRRRLLKRQTDRPRAGRSWTRAVVPCPIGSGLLDRIRK